MKPLTYFIIVLGLFEIISNFFHLSKGDKVLIGKSAKSVFYKRPFKVWMSLVVYLIPLIILLFLSGQVSAASKQAGDTLYPQQQFLFPINLGIEPVKHILVADYVDDPEYEMIEPQLFDDPICGKGIRILLYRKDKKVDVYWQPEVKFDTASLNVGGGPGTISQTEMSPARFNISGKGVDINIGFTDNHGRKVEIIIQENTPSTSGFPFLAPVGKDVQNLRKLFLAYMQEFDFVKIDGTIFTTKIGDRVLKPATFPIKRNSKDVYFARYAKKLTIGEINAPVNQVLVANFSPGLNSIGDINVWVNEKMEITQCRVYHNTDSVELDFESGFPNLLSLPQNKIVKGNWSFTVSDNQITGGKYVLLRKDNLVWIEFDVTRKWKPRELPFSFKVFTRVMRSFRTWPVSYTWNASVDLKTRTLHGEWHRK